MKHISKVALLPIIVTLALAPGPSLSAQPYTSPDYTLLGARIVVSGGSAGSVSYSAQNVTIGNFIGGEAISTNYVLKIGLPEIIAVSVEGEWILDGIRPGTSIMNNGTEIIIKNSGNVKMTCSLQAMDATNPSWDIRDRAGENSCAIRAVFTGRETTGIDDSAFGEEDILKEHSQEASDTRFAMPGHNKNGVDIMPGEERILWLKFDSPTVSNEDGGPKQHNLKIFVTVGS